MATDTLVLEAEGTDLNSLISTLESLPVGQERELRLYMPTAVPEDTLAALREEFQANGFTVLSLVQDMDILAIKLVRASPVSSVGFWMILAALAATGFIAWQITKTTQSVASIFTSIPPIAWVLGTAGLVYWLVSSQRRKSKE